MMYKLERIFSTFQTTRREAEEWKKFARENGLDYSSLIRMAVRAFIMEKVIK